MLCGQVTEKSERAAAREKAREQGVQGGLAEVRVLTIYTAVILLIYSHSFPAEQV